MYFVCLTISGDLYFTSFTIILYSELLLKVFVTFGLSLMSFVYDVDGNETKIRFSVSNSCLDIFRNCWGMVCFGFYVSIYVTCLCWSPALTNLAL
jgi:hypothetical protein